MNRDAADPHLMDNLHCPQVLMRFHLVYNGPLPPTGNKSRPDDARRIRDQFHPQLKLLWETHSALRRLRSTAVVSGGGADIALTASPFDEERDLSAPLRGGQVDLSAPVQRGTKTYQSLVTKALDLNCTLSVLFLRQEDPGALILDGGDLDNRIKTLCDALKVPDADIESRYPQAQNETYCLLESDTLVAGFEVQTDRLLFPKTKYPNEVHLVVEVEVRVLRVGPWNVCLLGN